MLRRRGGSVIKSLQKEREVMAVGIIGKCLLVESLVVRKES
jgi:hypothetical protein